MFPYIKEYINKNKDNVLIDLIEKYIKLFKENNTLDLFEEIIKVDPNINILNLNLNIFNTIYINAYGIDFLAHNYLMKTEYLNYGIRDEDIKCRILLLNKYGISINEFNKQILFSESMNLDFIKQNYEFIKKQGGNCKFLCEIEFKNIQLFNKLLNEETYEYKILYFGIDKITDFNYDNFIKILNLDKKVVSNIIDMINNNYFEQKSRYIDFLEIYNRSFEILKKISKKEINSELKKLFNLYINEHNVRIKTKEELYSIKDIRKKYYFEKIKNEESIIKIKDYICINFFDKSYNDIKDNILKYKKVKEKFNTSSLEKLNILEQLLNIDNKNNLITFYNNYNNLYDYVSDLDNLYIEFCKKELVKSLTIINDGQRVVNFSGEDFKLLIHKIKGCGARQIAHLIIDNPSFWDKCDNEYSYISTSLISNDYFGMIDGYGYVLGFNKIKSDLILDMGTEDIFYSTKNHKNKTSTLKSKFLLPEELIYESKSLYNEVTIKGMEKKVRTQPDFVLAKNSISDTEKEVSDYFKIPIYLLDTYIYSEKLKEKIDTHLKNLDIKNYYNYRLKLALSIIDNPELMLKYFNNLNEDTETVIKKINLLYYDNNYKSECVKLILKLNQKINNLMNYFYISHEKYNYADDKKILKLD